MLNLDLFAKHKRGLNYEVLDIFIYLILSMLFMRVISKCVEWSSSSTLSRRFIGMYTLIPRRRNPLRKENSVWLMSYLSFTSHSAYLLLFLFLVQPRSLLLQWRVLYPCVHMYQTLADSKLHCRIYRQAFLRWEIMGNGSIICNQR